MTKNEYQAYINGLKEGFQLLKDYATVRTVTKGFGPGEYDAHEIDIALCVAKLKELENEAKVKYLEAEVKRLEQARSSTGTWGRD